MRKDKQKVSRPRREHAGGAPSVAYDQVSQELIPMPVGVAMPPSAADIDESMGLKEPGEKTAGNEMADGPAAILRLIAWMLEPLSHEEIIDGRKRQIYMDPKLSAFAKAVVLQLFLRPNACGLKSPSIATLSPIVGVCRQTLSRVSLDLRRVFPGFVSQQMRSTEVREIYRQAHLHASEKTDGGEQLTIGF